MAFNPGDVVILKSGGPRMTVERSGNVGGHEVVWCVWFEKTEQKRQYFATEALQRF